MRVLLISHTVLSKTGNMGKTLSGYLSQFRNDQVAQFYIHSEVPTDDSICRNYYRFTDVDALKSILLRWHKGTIFTQEDVCTDRISTRVDRGAAEALYVSGSRRRPFTMAMRELLWVISSWKSGHLKKWLKDFDPDILFYAAGDYMFTYRIARWMASYLGKPLVLVCTDDYYCHNRNSGEFLGRCLYGQYMRTVRRTMKDAKLVFTICDNMAREYSDMFRVPCRVLHTGANRQPVELKVDRKHISYIGNMGYGRYMQLIDLAEALQAINPEYVLEVYSPSKRVEEIEAVENAPGIRFHGAIPAQEVLRVMENSLAVIHTESFDERMQNMVRFSVSTKIAESLMYGPCMIAYGPEGIASIDYLKEHHAAHVITSKEELVGALREFLDNETLRAEILQNARRLAEQNHDIRHNSRMVYDSLREVCDH